MSFLDATAASHEDGCAPGGVGPGVEGRSAVSHVLDWELRAQVSAAPLGLGGPTCPAFKAQRL